MDIILSVIILCLLFVLFYREIKNDQEVELFINIVISSISIGSSLISFYQNHFYFNLISDYVNIIIIIVAIIFTGYYLKKYFKNKKIDD